MKKDEKHQGEYVRKVGEDTRRYVQDLLGDYKKTLGLVASLEAEKQHLQEEKLRLQEQLLALKEEINRHHGEQVELRRQMADVETDVQRFTEQYVAVEQQNANLANLYVASFRLHSTLERQEVLGVIQEIIVNLIGSEEIAIFELDPKKSVLSLVASVGIEPARYQAIPLGTGCIGRAALTGELYLHDGNAGSSMSPQETHLTACIPLKVDGQVSGVIAIFRLLQQKPDLEALDHELFDLLATHAAVALYCTELHSKLGASVVMTA
ncbi:MAG: GAF domain-containing protein [Candidatus Binatia bacterium]